jgi:hypothetical protein
LNPIGFIAAFPKNSIKLAIGGIQELQNRREKRTMALLLGKGIRGQKAGEEGNSKKKA